MATELIEKLENLKYHKDCGNRNCEAYAAGVDAAIEVVREHTEWCDIATAPKNRSPILAIDNQGFSVCCEKGQMVVAKWDASEDDWVWSETDRGPFTIDATHWMPLPPAPKDAP